MLAEATLQATGAQNCSLLLLEGTSLKPALAKGAHPDQERWSAFKRMAHLEVDERRREAFLGSRAVAIEDARNSRAIPVDWVTLFDLRAMVLVPLRAGTEPLGLMVVDWSSPRRCDAEMLALLESIGAFAGVAIRNARLFRTVVRRAELQAALGRAASALSAPAIEPDLIARRLLDSCSELFGARRCALGFSDARREQITTTLEWDGEQYAPGPLETSSIPSPLVSQFLDKWSIGKSPVEFRAEPWLMEFLGAKWAALDWFLLVPLVVQGHARGAVLLGFQDSTQLDAQERAAAEALAAMAASAIERHDLVDQLALQLRQRDALIRIIAGLSEATDAAGVVTRLNEILEGYGIQVTSVAFRDRALARRLGAAELTSAERGPWGADRTMVLLADDTAAIPMRQGRRVVGSLRVRPTGLDGAQIAFLTALGRGIADVATRDQLRWEIEDSARERALTAERERIAADLHDTTGQIFVALGLLARRHAELLPLDSDLAAQARRIAELADQGKWQMVEALRALAFVPAGSRALPAALRGLLHSFEFDSGIAVSLAVSGQAARLAAPTERVLYRVAHEALINAWRHAHCTSITVELTFDEREVLLAVTDDGVGVGAMPAAGGHFGISGMRRLISEVGGTLRIENSTEPGLSVSACVPR